MAIASNSAHAADTTPPPGDNPLRAADEATRQQATAEAWGTFQHSCRPCHGALGAGDGPYANTFPRAAADLRRPSRDIATDAARFTRISDGAAALRERPTDSNMPAFGGSLDDRQIWGLVLLLEDFGNRGTGLPAEASGADIYAGRCSVCHGATGVGNGALAAELLPAPTDLVHGPYRFRSTPFGAAPTENDIMTVTANGLSHTAMGAFKSIGPNQLEDVNAHVVTLAAALLATPVEPIPGSPLPTQPIGEMVTSGRAVYAKAGCADCHGAVGRGDGAKGVALTDAAGHPAIPTDLTKRWRYKRGGGSPTTFNVLTSGVNGTPMVSYAETLSADERWQVAYYLERLARNGVRFNTKVLASVGNADVPSDPAASFWDTVAATAVPLGPQLEHVPFWTQPSVDVVDVKAAVHGDDIALLLTWNDRTKDVKTDDAGKVSSVAAALKGYGGWRLPDQIAIQFPEKPDPKGSLPPPYAGDSTHPVRRWIWSAERMERGESNAVIDRGVGPRTEPEVVSDAPPIATSAMYADGQWRVLFRGKRPPKATAFPIALQAWDGAAGESGRWQSFSGWLMVTLK